MKNFKTIAIALFVAVASISLNAQNKKIDVASSTIKWVGKKVTGEYQGKLNGHLKADDFFGTEKFPTAKLVFKKIGTTKTANVYAVTADLTIKGITKPVTFDLTVNPNSATTAFKVDRTKYDIKYNSGNFFENLGDKTINDDFELAVALKF
ncbi:MAG: YceI family protein [Flavobacterium sp.]